MNEQEFSIRWSDERPMYDAWGAFVVSEICSKLLKSGKNLDSYLKQPAKHRLKDEASLIDKAFYRDKNYENPFDDIEDKVGCRFVVLLIEHVDEISNLINDMAHLWFVKECRHYSIEKEKEPLLFTYQSVHFVVRAAKEFVYEETLIKQNTPCEIQIRTLLQHAYAELTHDAIYKARTLVKPQVHRTVAKSMALIETTDEFFMDVSSSLASGNVYELSFQEQLDEIYSNYIELNPTKAQKSSIVILDAFDEIIDNATLTSLSKFLRKKEFIKLLVRQGRSNLPFYSQSIVIFIYWLISKKKTILLKNWPLDRKILEILANDIGVSFEDFG